MNYGKWFEGLMAMNDATWQRHANPWSVWTRIPLLPLFALAIWSRIWIGAWCLVPIAILVCWTFINPRAFAKPASSDHWASKATFGERVWLSRNVVPIPAHHARATIWLNIFTASGVIPLTYGLVAFDLAATLLGLGIIIMGKLWFLDRMVWLFQDMKDQDERYSSWLY